MSKVISSVAGTRTEPLDSYTFVRGTEATFKMTFTSGGTPTKVDVNTTPIARIMVPAPLTPTNQTIPQVIAEVEGALTPGQEFEYSFNWQIPSGQIPSDEYIVSYYGTVGAMFLNFGDEFFSISGTVGPVGIKAPVYATVSDVRLTKANIDDYIPATLRKDLTSRNDYIESRLMLATNRLREELSLHKSRSNSENYRLFAVFYTIWLILLSARGEDGSSVSDQNLIFWRSEWERILSQEKRESVFQGISLGRG